MGFEFTNQTIRALCERGFLYQFTSPESIDKLFNSDKSFSFYVGFDATAKSLHVGHLLWIIAVNRLQRTGYRAIILTGGGTSKIGDPTWKDKQRVMLGSNEISANIDSVMRKLRTLIDFADSSANCAKLVNNDDWLSKIEYLPFLRDYGRFFSVNRMLSMDSISERLKRRQHLSFLEFNYMLLQAYDFLHLFNTENCVVQIGGADQWANIIFGVELIKKVYDKEAYGMTLNLLTTSTGAKMGKTESGTVWLDEEMTSPFDFWQYFRNVDDRDVCKLLKLFTDIELSEIDSYGAMIGTPSINEAKIKLADNITSFVHGKDCIASIKATVNNLFGNGSENQPYDIEEFRFQSSVQLDRAVFETGLAPSMSMSRKLIEGRGVKVDGSIVDSIKYRITASCVLSVGKKNFVKIAVEE
ncbi:MAG: tyrosine--tRNA ligase [Holosporales bacterium]|nr:tyrosine--tRNA ligase [Holosporales bacterium]